MTNADVRAEDLLFATLDPTMRAFKLPGFDKAILSDTVGFVSDLPTELVAAFRATLEEVESADLILHVRDIAHPDSDAQAADVEAVLASLGLHEPGSPARLEVWNKLDLLDGAARQAAENEAARRGDVACVSALTGWNVEELRTSIARRLDAGDETRRLKVSAGDGNRLAWLHARGNVLDQRMEGETMHLAVRLSPANWARYEAL